MIRVLSPCILPSAQRLNSRTRQRSLVLSLTEEESRFADEGRVLPFPIRRWRHVHRITRDLPGSTIADEIEFATPFFLLDFLLFPLIWLQFTWRKRIYRKIFGRP